MTKYSGLMALVLALGTVGNAILPAAAARADAALQIAGCEAGAKIDGTTEAQTRKRIEAAGYTQIHNLMKACDNVWHAVAVNKDGTSGNILVSPQGEVMPEGN